MQVFILDTKRAWKSFLAEHSIIGAPVSDGESFSRVSAGDVVILHSGDTSEADLLALLRLKHIKMIRLGFVSGGAWPPRVDGATWTRLNAESELLKLERCEHDLEKLSALDVARVRSWLSRLLGKVEPNTTEADSSEEFLTLVRQASAWRQILRSCLLAVQRSVGGRAARESFKQATEPLLKADFRRMLLPEAVLALAGAVQVLKSTRSATEWLLPNETTPKTIRVPPAPIEGKNPLDEGGLMEWLREFKALSSEGGGERATQMEGAELGDTLRFCAEAIGSLCRQCEAPLTREIWWVEADRVRSVLWHDSLTKDLVYRLIDGSLQAKMADLEEQCTKRKEALLKNLPTRIGEPLNRNLAFGLREWCGDSGRRDGIGESVRRFLLTAESPPAQTALCLSASGIKEIAAARAAVEEIDRYFRSLRDPDNGEPKDDREITVAETWKFWEACLLLVRFHDKSKGFLALWRRNFEAKNLSDEK